MADKVANGNETAGGARRLPRPSHSAVYLPEDGPLRRGLIAPKTARQPDFLARYEDRALFYDCYWTADQSRVLLHGPSPVDLAPHYARARYRALPSGTALKWRKTQSPHLYMVVLSPPPGTTHIEIGFADLTFTVAVQPNHSDWFAGENVLFTQSQNNHLNWIADWAKFHVAEQEITAIAFFDNLSTAYGLEDIERVLERVPGLRKFMVMSTPHRYQLLDRAYPRDAFWAHFLQPSVITRMFRRFGMQTRALLNCDIDELMVRLGDKTLCDEAVEARSGTVYARARWVEGPPKAGAVQPFRHADFSLVKPESLTLKGRTDKWVVAPQRRWLDDLKIHPYPHLFENRPMLTRVKTSGTYMAHFRAISTSWKYDRSMAAQGSGTGLVPDPFLQAAFARTGLKGSAP